MTSKGGQRGTTQIRFHATRRHQITSYGRLGTEHAVAYDAAGRMASRVTKTGATPATAKSESYFFDAVDRLTQVVVHSGTGRYVTGAAQDSTTRYWYDAEGQRVRTQVTAGTRVSNTHHLFAEVEVRDGETTKYYFAAGLRIAGRVVASSSGSSAGDLLSGLPFRGIELPPGLAVGLALVLLLLLLSPGLRGRSRWRILLVPTRAVATAAFFWLALLPPGLAKAALPGDVTLWHYHVDHLGSVHSITDAAGNLYRQTRYTAYGEVRGRYNGSGAVVAAEAALRHEFTGYQSEETSGLQYAGARYYLPELGVFASHDPADQFASPYAYGPGDPVNGTDPTGTFFDLGLVLLGLSIAGVVANAIYTGIKTGSAEAGLDAFATGLALTVVSYVVSAGLAAGLEALGGEALRQAYQTASTGYSGYSVGQSASRGDTIGAVVGGLSLALVAYGALQDANGTPSHKTVSGQGEEAKQVGQAAEPREGPLDSATAFAHYREGSGEPLRMSFHDIDTSKVRPSQFEMVQEALGQGARDATLSIDNKMTFSTSGDQAWFLGDIRLRLQGELVIQKSGEFRFTGTLKSHDDVYDFNKGARGWLGEFATWFGRQTTGTPYDIQIRGAKPISEVGRVR